MAASQQTLAEQAATYLANGRSAIRQGRLEQAAEALVTAESMYRQAGDSLQIAEVRLELAEVQRRSGALDQAARSYAQAAEIFKQAESAEREATATLTLGHVERQQGKLDRAWEHYYLALRLFEKSDQREGQADAALALGHVERLRGHDRQAADYYQQARTLYADLANRLGEADAARGYADMIARPGQYDEARQALHDARDVYRAIHDQFGEVDATVGLGRLAAASGQIDDANTSFGEAIATALAIEYELGAADGTLGLAETALLSGRLDQALGNALKAEQTYNDASSALGTAESNRVLGAVYLLRGQLNQSIAVFDRAARALESLRARLPYTHALLGSAEANRRKGVPRKAEDLFAEAREIASEVERSDLASVALLGLGRMARVHGQSDQATEALTQAGSQLEAADLPALAAQAYLELALLEITRGRFDVAAEHIQHAEHLAQSAASLASGTVPASIVALTHSALASATGQLDTARARATEALRLAQQESDSYFSAIALLALADIELSAEKPDAAVRLFNRVQSLPQATDAAPVQALADLGLARVLLQRGLWDEALIAHQETVPRLRAAGDRLSLVFVHRGTAEAHLQQGSPDPARQASLEMKRTAQACGAPLLVAEANHLEGRALFELGELEAAVGALSQAIGQVTEVANSLADAAQRARFFGSRHTLWADAVHLSARELNEERTHGLATQYRSLADTDGRAAAAQRLREYEQAIPQRSSDLTKEELQRNRKIVQLLESARKTLVSDAK